MLYVLTPKDGIMVGLQSLSGYFIRPDRADIPLWLQSNHASSFYIRDMGGHKWAFESEYYQTFLRCGQHELKASNDVAIMEKWMVDETTPGQLSIACQHDDYSAMYDAGVAGQPVSLLAVGSTWGLMLMLPTVVEKEAIGEETAEELYRNRANPCLPNGFCVDLVNRRF